MRMPMKITIDPVLASRIKNAWGQLDQSRPDLKAQILTGMQYAHLQAVQVAQEKTPPSVAAAPPPSARRPDRARHQARATWPAAWKPVL
jgi:hypothetical protein